MPNRHLESTAASLLSSWTDSDTAMQIVGTSLGLLGPGLLDPTVVLSRETPLRNALFDVLLSLVEGGALDVRPTEDAGYAFRFRTDFATAALDPGTSQAIDIDTPNPYLDELIQARRERDEALGRADFAEALAAERERLLRLGETPRATRPARRTRLPAAKAVRQDPAPTEAPADEIDLTAIEAEEATSAPIEAPAHEPATVAAAADATANVPADPVAAVESSPEPAFEPAVEPEPVADVAPVTPVSNEPETAEGLPPAPVIAPAPLDEPLTAADASAEPEAALVEPAPKKVAAKAVKKAPPKKAAPKKAAPKKRAAKNPPAKTSAAEDATPGAVTTEAAPAIAPETAPETGPAVVPEPAEREMPEHAPSEVVYLPAPAPPEPPAAEPDDDARVVAADETTTRRAKWSGYTLDKPRAHLSSVDRIADDG